MGVTQHVAQLCVYAADRPLVYIKYCCSGRLCCAALRSMACLLAQHVQYTLSVTLGTDNLVFVIGLECQSGSTLLCSTFNLLCNISKSCPQQLSSAQALVSTLR